MLELMSVFPTLQGEGPYAGWPAVFVRLGGCNLACSFCDTEFENFETRRMDDIVACVKQHAQEGDKRVRHLVVITGGEPFRQNIAPLCEALVAEKFKVQIETNGTLYRALPEAVEIICSPKNTGTGYYPVREDLLARVTAFKFIVARGNAQYDHVAEVGQSRFGTPVYVQPMDEYRQEKNADNLSLALALATKHGYLLSLQIHKLLGIE